MLPPVLVTLAGFPRGFPFCLHCILWILGEWRGDPHSLDLSIALAPSVPISMAFGVYPRLFQMQSLPLA